jgi:hypothetical protein
LLLVDEVGALGASARHLRGLVGRAREAGLAVVLATQGPSDLEAVDHALLSQVLQDTSWQLAFRQGSPQDAEQLVRLFGEHQVVDTTRYSDGRRSWRDVEHPRVPVDEWLNGLRPGDAWLRVAPVDRGWRQERVRVALPTKSVTVAGLRWKETTERALGKWSGNRVESGAETLSNDAPAAARTVHTPAALPAVPPDCPDSLRAMMGEDILAKVERKWSKRHHELGPCLVWRTGESVIRADGGVYGRFERKLAHRVVWERCYGPIKPKSLTVDHVCQVTLCQRPDHPRLISRSENSRRRWGKSDG